jgi:hypothetical protein
VSGGGKKQGCQTNFAPQKKQKMAAQKAPPFTSNSNQI